MNGRMASAGVGSALLLIASGAGAVLVNRIDSPPPREANEDRISPTLTELPLSFVKNRGQADPRAPYYLHGSDASVYFTPGGLRLSFEDTTGTTQRWNLALDFVGARPTAPQGMGKTPAVVSYFKGNRKDWHTGVPTYARVAYRDLWPGIDLVYKGTGSRLKYSFVVHPRADPKDIRLKWRGATALTVDEKDRLLVSTPARSFTDEAPLSHQMIRGRKLTVATSYSVDGTTYGFDLGAYDPTTALVIDPAMLIYAGYIGGSGTDSGYGIAVDASGAAYITGSTTSTEATFPEAVGPDLTHNGNLDAFVVKVAPSGTTLSYAGYIGGTSSDTGYGVAVDGTGAAYVAGSTFSTEATFPVTVGPDLTHNGSFDAFVVKVVPSGVSLTYAGYIGGVALDFGYGITTDAPGGAYIVGETSSTDATFPDGNGFGTLTGPDLTYNGGTDAFVAKVVPSGVSLFYAGYLGGSGTDAGNAVGSDAAGAMYVAGETSSTEATFPDGDGFGPVPGPDVTYNGGQDAFVAKVASSGAPLSYASYIGGSGIEEGNGLAVDASGATYVTGDTSSTEATFPKTVGPDLTYNGSGDAFVAKVAAPGTSLTYAGYIGGSGLDEGNGLAVDVSGAAYVTGQSSSTQATFPDGDGFGTLPGPDASHNGGLDTFVAKVVLSGASLAYAGYIGGSGTEFGYGVSVDGAGGAYVTGDTDSTEATFPEAAGPDLTHNGGNDAFVAKVEAFPPPGHGPAPTPGSGGTCQGKAVTHLGTEGNDVLTGTSGADVVLGLGGKDTIRTKGGNDRICAGRGNDSVKGGRGKDRLLGQRGNDNLDGGAGRDLCRGGPGRDRIKRCERGGG